MIKHCFILFFSLFLITAPADSKVASTNTMLSILDEIKDANTLVLFDIDDTLIIRETMLGSTPWWEYCLKMIQETGVDKKKAQDKLLPLFFQASLEMPVVLVEESAPNLIAHLHNQGIEVLAMTSRPRSYPWQKNFDYITFQELYKKGIRFISMQPSQLPFFYRGIIFAGHGKKEQYLTQFLAERSVKPSKIIFIDNDATHQLAVEKTLESLHIPSVCFRYSRMDEQHAAFDPLISNIQLQNYLEHGNILHDEEALRISKQIKQKDPHFYMRQLIQSIAR